MTKQLRTSAVAAAAALVSLAPAQCLDWADGFAADELGTDYLIRAFYPVEEGGEQVLYAGGGFSFIGGVEASGIARWDGTAWAPLGLGVDGTVHDIVTYDDGTGPALYVAGSFYHAGGLPIRFLARWKDGEWSDPGADLGYFAYALEVHDSRLFVAGGFDHMGGEPTEHMASWDGGAWERFVGGPSARKGHALTYDPVHDYVLLFGGDEENGIEQQDTWSFDGSGWSRLMIGGPEPRDGQTMTYDSARQRVLMFGGEPRGWGSPDSRLWAWDGSTWTVAAGFMPVARFQVTVTYDSARDRVVWFGGREGSSNYFDDTWEFDGVQWAEVIPATTRPPARTLYALAYDEARQRVVMFGGDGYSAGTLGDTWEWDGTDWVMMADSGPSPRYDCAMAYDSQRQQMVLYGGRNGGDYFTDTWGWNGSAWTLLAPADPDRLNESDGPVTYDPVRDRVVLRDKRGVTWLWDGSAWEALNEGGVNAEVYDLASFDAGWGPELYACGYFTKAGSISAPRIARLTDEGWQGVGGGIQDTYCYTLFEWDDGGGPDLYIGGSFNMADNQPMQSIGRWDGSAWSILNVGDAGDGGGVVGAVRTIFAYDDGSGEKLYVGGYFDLVDGPGIGYDGDIEARNIARWDRSVWEPVGAHIDPQAPERGVFALAGADLVGQRRLLAGGSFDSAGGKPSSNLAVWGDPCTPPTIVEQPEDVIAMELEPVIFSTRAWGTRPLAFQWRKDGTDLIDDGRITGSASEILLIDPWIESDAGVYDVVVTNAHGSVVSDPAGLTTFPGGNSGGAVAVATVMLPPAPCPWDDTTYINSAGSATTSTTADGVFWVQAADGIDALMRWQNGAATPIVKVDDPAPGTEPGVLFGNYQRDLRHLAFVSSGAEISFSASLSGDGIFDNNDRGVWRSVGSAMELVQREGDPAPGFPPGVTIDGEWGGQAAFAFQGSRGQWLTFNGALEGGGYDPRFDRALWRWSGTTGAQVLVQRNMPAPHNGVNVLEFWAPAHMDTGGNTLLHLSLETRTGYKYNPNAWDSALLLGTPGEFAVVAQSGDPAPGFAPEVNLDQINGGYQVLLSDSRDVAFSCRASGPDDFTARALYHWNDGVLTPLAIEGNPAPGIPDDLPFFAAEAHAINGIGDAAFTGQLNNNGCGSGCPDHGFFIGLGGQVSAVAYRFMAPVPGLGDGFAYEGTGRAAINDERQMIFEGGVKLNGASLGGIFGWVEDKGMFPIAVPGSQLEVAPDDIRVVVHARLFYVGSGIDGDHLRAAGISDDGRFLFQASFSNGTHGVFEGDFVDFLRNYFPCVADFNEDDSVDTRDVLAFLNAWVAGDSRADINEDGTVNTLDVIAFLNLWTQGC